MASDATTICNLALARIGEIQIISLDDNLPEALFCKQFYASTRDEVLRSHPWNFATERATLSRVSPPPLFGWRYQYALPSDFIRLMQLNGHRITDSTKLHDIEGKNLLTDEEVAEIRYIKRIEDANLFDSLFIEALECKIASKLAIPLAGSRALSGDLTAEYERIVAPLARVTDAKESRPGNRPPWADSMLRRARFGRVF